MFCINSVEIGTYTNLKKLSMGTQFVIVPFMGGAQYIIQMKSFG